MAQVTLSGTFDFSPMSTGKLTTQAASGGTASTAVKTSTTGSTASWATNDIRFKAVEDLGGGLSLTAYISQSASGNGFAARDNYVDLAGGFGSVRIGRFSPSINSYTTDGAGTSNTAGTTYGMSSGGATFSGVLGATSSMTAGSFQRQSNLVQYTSPNMNGFTASVLYANTTTDSSVLAGEAKVGQTGLNLSYSAGPLKAYIGTNDRDVDAKGTSTTAFGDKIAASYDYVGASYDLGVAKISASHATRKDTTTVTAGTATINSDISMNAFGVSVPVGAMTLTASTYSGTDARNAGVATDDMKLSGNQFSLSYPMSKRTRLYAVVGENNVKRDAGSTAATSKSTATSVGLVHSF
jgi:predicted porin